MIAARIKFQLKLTALSESGVSLHGDIVKGSMDGPLHFLKGFIILSPYKKNKTEGSVSARQLEPRGAIHWQFEQSQ